MQPRQGARPICLLVLCLSLPMTPNSFSNLQAFPTPTTGPIYPVAGQYANYTEVEVGGFLTKTIGWHYVNYSATEPPSSGLINASLLTNRYGTPAQFWQVVNTTDRTVVNSSTGPPVSTFYYGWWIQNRSLGEQVLFGSEYKNVTGSENLYVPGGGAGVPLYIPTYRLGPGTKNQSSTAYWFDQVSGHLVKYETYGSNANGSLPSARRISL